MIQDIDWDDGTSPSAPCGPKGAQVLRDARAHFATLIPMVESMFAGEPIPEQVGLLELVSYVQSIAPPGLAPLLPLLGPDCRYLDRVVSAYRWPQWHRQILAGGAAGDFIFMHDVGFTIRLLLLDAGRAETVAQAQLAIFARALVCDGGLGAFPLCMICTLCVCFPLQWPTLPPGHAEVSALMTQLAADKSGGFATLDLVTLGTMQEQLHSLFANSMAIMTKEYGGAPVFSQLHVTSALLGC